MLISSAFLSLLRLFHPTQIAFPIFDFGLLLQMETETSTKGQNNVTTHLRCLFIRLKDIIDRFIAKSTNYFELINEIIKASSEPLHRLRRIGNC